VYDFEYIGTRKEIVMSHILTGLKQALHQKPDSTFTIKTMSGTYTNAPVDGRSIYSIQEYFDDGLRLSILAGSEFVYSYVPLNAITEITVY
jgi:hypothetical protein